MSVEDSESRRFEPNIRPSFYEADLGPTSAPELFLSRFSKSLGLFFTKRAHRKRYLFFVAGIFKIQSFY